MACTNRTNKAVVDRAKKQLATAKDPVEKLRLICLSRGATGIKGLSRTFKIYDDDHSHTLDFSEFKKGIHDYGIDDMDTEELQNLFAIFDKDKSGTIDFDEFLVKLRPPMNKTRKDLVFKAFQKLDKTGDGVITIADLKGVYNVTKHKKYLSGEYTEDQCLGEFLDKFDSEDKDGTLRRSTANNPEYRNGRKYYHSRGGNGVITKEEWLNYYSGVSSSIDNDAYFDLMMRNAWKL